jgi:hypothetical protein
MRAGIGKTDIKHQELVTAYLDMNMVGTLSSAPPARAGANSTGSHCSLETPRLQTDT